MSHDSAAANTGGPDPATIESPPPVERDRQLINAARQQGTGSLLWAFTRLSGPGWLQSAITLGGGSLGGSLYLGVLVGFGLMWLQPLAMILGVIMLSAIGYVTLSTGERPFRAINRHINPVLGWSWALATLMANLVWCMPQFSLGTAAIQQNLAPHVLGSEAVAAAVVDAGLQDAPAEEREELESRSDFRQKLICASILFFAAAVIVWFYDTGGWGIKLFELLLKAMVATVVICFFGVVIKMTTEGLLDWGAIFGGFVPDFSLLTEPAPALREFVSATGAYADYWTNEIVREQQKVMITAAATAVGINMTFLLPYSMLQRGWDRDFRGLAIFDLSTGLFVPFVLATGCVVIASATQFHGRVEQGLVEIYRPSEDAPQPAGNLVKGFNGLLDGRITAEIGKEQMRRLQDEAGANQDDSQLEALRADLPDSDLRMAAALVKRDNFNLANSLQGLVGSGTAQTVFGIGVLGMAISTIIILMLINGFVVCEMLGLPQHAWPHRLGALLAGAVGFLGPFVWSKAAAWLVVPTSMFGMMLLPIAYVTFLCMMNSQSLMRENMPRGGKRLLWNVLMLIAAGLATFGSYWSIKSSPYPTLGYAGVGGLILLALIVHVLRKSKTS